MIDIHTHILPMVDDGAASFEDALAILKLQQKQGVDRVILTPHVQNRVQKVSSKEFKKRFEEFKMFVKEHLPEMKLFLGAEVKYDSLKNTDYRQYTIENTDYLLIEFSTNKTEDIVDVLYNLVAKGFKPILAHCERYTYLSVTDLIRIKEDGSLLQVNSGAVLGDDGKIYKKLAMKYIELGLIDFIASDCHDTEHRGPTLVKALEKVKKVFKMKDIEI